MKTYILSLSFFLSTVALAAPKRVSTLDELKLRQEFSVELLARVQMQAILNHQMALTIRKCNDNPANKSEECQIVRSTIIKPFEQVVADARMFLLLGYRDSIFGESFQRLNSGMSDLKTYKDESWYQATGNEINVANRVLADWRKEASAAASRKASVGSNGPKHDRFVGLTIREKRVKLLEEYKAILSQIVILQPFRSTSVTPANFRAALNVIIERGAKEIETLKKAARTAENWMKDPESCAETVDYQTANPSFSEMPMTALSYCIFTPPNLAELLDYSSVVQGLTTDFPAYAKVAKSMERERTARTLGIAAMVAIPTLAVCIFAPPLVAIPAGAAVGGVSLLQSQADYNRVRRREISRVVNENGDVDWASLKSARLMRNMNVVLLPFFGAGRFIGPFARATASRAYLQGTIRLKQLILKKGGI